MIFMLLGCLIPDLAGDAVYPNTSDDLPVSEMEEIAPDDSTGGDTQLGVYDLTFTESDNALTSTIDIEIDIDTIHVVHNNIALNCDMTLYNTEISMNGFDIYVYYMPLEDERNCFYNASFSLDKPNLTGSYVLHLMEDSTQFTIE